MKKYFAVCLFLMVMLAFSSSAMAKKQQLQDIDFGAITCQEFIVGIAQSDEESAAMILMWLDGYLSGVSGDTVLSWNNLDAFSGDVMDACAKNPNEKLLDVAKEVGISQ